MFIFYTFFSLFCLYSGCHVSAVAYLGGGGAIVPWPPPPLADGNFLKGLKTGERADGPPFRRMWAENWRKLEKVTKKKKSSSWSFSKKRVDRCWLPKKRSSTFCGRENGSPPPPVCKFLNTPLCQWYFTI
jgi:hypothetical protein